MRLFRISITISARFRSFRIFLFLNDNQGKKLLVAANETKPFCGTVARSRIFVYVIASYNFISSEDI